MERLAGEFWHEWVFKVDNSREDRLRANSLYWHIIDLARIPA
jgi:hypothetical protein